MARVTIVNHSLDNLTYRIHDITLLLLIHVRLPLSSCTDALLISPSPSDRKRGRMTLIQLRQPMKHQPTHLFFTILSMPVQCLQRHSCRISGLPGHHLDRERHNPQLPADAPRQWPAAHAGRLPHRWMSKSCPSRLSLSAPSAVRAPAGNADSGLHPPCIYNNVHAVTAELRNRSNSVKCCKLGMKPRSAKSSEARASLQEFAQPLQLEYLLIRVRMRLHNQHPRRELPEGKLCADGWQQLHCCQQIIRRYEL